MSSVYLAGGIEGIPVEVAAEWRIDLAARLLPYAKSLDPMRRTLFQHGGDSETIFQNDLDDIHNCDVVAANLLHGSCTGTKFELGYAFALNRKIVILCSPELAEHPFIRCCGIVTTNINDFYNEVLKQCRTSHNTPATLSTSNSRSST